MDGTHYGEEHLIYMERKTTILFKLGLLFSLVCWDFASSCCFAGLQCCLAQGCSRSGIPTSSLGKERFFGKNFLILTFWKSYLLQLQHSFCLELGCVAGCSKGGSLRVIYGLVFQWRGCLSIGGLARRTLGNILTSLTSGQPFSIPHSVVSILNCDIFGCICWEGSLSSSGGSISE